MTAIYGKTQQVFQNEAEQFVANELKDIIDVLVAVEHDAVLRSQIHSAAKLIHNSFALGYQVLFLGNGGSAADAQHLAGEFVGKLNRPRKPLPALALTEPTFITAIGNDYGFDNTFVRQVEAYCVEDDVVVALSTSGNSPNVVKALQKAKAIGAATVGLTGKTGGEMAAFCDICLKMPSTNTQKIQEAHIVVGHIICGLVEQALEG